MGHSWVKNAALSNIELLSDVLDRKDKLYHCAWARYEDCTNGAVRLLPNENNHNLLVQDYRAMQSMIFGDRLSWGTILSFLQELEDEINNTTQQNRK
ncbi:MAG: hypothetical protein LBU15_00690 [Rickettsiales bacterium]|jgi:hypothetical protein|nr:hypothetical protein [Rickettsiales bacterium]